MKSTEKLTKEEENYQAAMLCKLADAAKADEERQSKKGDFKIQIWFTSDRRTADASYTLSFWESGKRLHGGGDEMMFVCRRHEHAPRIKPFEVAHAKVNISPKGCDGLIPGGLVGAGGLVVCPHCQTRHRSEIIADSIFYRSSMTKASEILAKWWRKMNHNADIYVKYCPTDPRVILMSKTMSPKKARELEGLTIYPLENIIKDTNAGSTVESRFRALITA